MHPFLVPLTGPGNLSPDWTYPGTADNAVVRQLVGPARAGRDG